MSWIGPTVRTATKLGAKYGPHAVEAWRVGGKHVTAAAQTLKDEYAARRAAIEHAETVVDGTVLKTVHAGSKVWVVFAGDKPVESYPQVPVDLDALIADADLANRVTPHQLREQAAAARAKRAAASTPQRAQEMARRALEKRKASDSDELPPGSQP